MARARTLCAVCAAPVTNLIRVTTACPSRARRLPRFLGCRRRSQRARSAVLGFVARD
jgi:hypothetical protein